MSHKPNTPITLTLIGILTITSCTAPPKVQSSPDNITVTVSILPEKYFVERIGGGLVDVNVMVGPGESPHSYEPKASQMTALARSSAYFAIGVEFEDAWMDRIASANPDMPIIDLTGGIEFIEGAGDHDHDEDNFDESSNEEHGDEHEEEEHLDEPGHQEMDPHIWTSPANAVIISEKIYETLANLDPENADQFEINLKQLLADIAALQADINEALAARSSDQFMVFHPAWGYFAEEFGLVQIPIEAGGSEPSAGELAEIITEAKETNISVIFAQPEFSTRSADFIAEEIGGSVILVSPLAEDWLDNMRLVAQAFAEAL